MTRYRPREKQNIDFFLAVDMGILPGFGNVAKFGRKKVVDSDGEYDIWDGASPLYTWPDSACVLSVQSTSASDSASGAGVQQIRLYGLLDDYSAHDEYITLNGTTTVQSACAYRRVYRMHSSAAGSSASNAGEISACGNGIGLSYILAGNGQTLMAIYTVPLGYTGYIRSWYISINRNVAGEADLRLKTRTPNCAWRVRRHNGVNLTGTSFINQVIDIPIKIEEKNDIRISGSANQNDTDLSGGFNIILVENAS